jgi:hypothetical protein
MKKTSLLRILCIAIMCIAFGWAPEFAFAQRGGHGGGGGMHGSAGGFHGGGGGGGHYAYGGARYGGYRGGGYYGYRGGGYYGWRGGYYGWRGGYWGYPRYGYGWGFGIGFVWGSYWPGYGYPYGYSSGWAPYYYPYYAPYGYPYPYNGDDYNGDDNPPPPDPGPKSRNNAPVKPSRVPAPGSFPNANSATTYVAASAPEAPLRTTDRTTVTTSNYRLASATQPVPPPRQEVQNAIRAMREMPPYAFQRRIDSGNYSNFTPKEREIVNSSSQYPLTWEKP